jgi:predicted O-methyltransferase YrrM
VTDDYILEHIDPEPEHLIRLSRTANIRLLNPRMIAGHLQGRILKMLVAMIRPRRVLEIGTFTGYATLCMAEALSPDGEIHTIEADDEMEDFIREQISVSPFYKQIHLHIGDALKVIPALEGLFDIVYIDGDKREYCAYYDAIFPKISIGGFIFADNTLWGGKVVETPHPSDRHTVEIIRFNDMIANDARIERIILPVRDGLTVARKLKD